MMFPQYIKIVHVSKMPLRILPIGSNILKTIFFLGGTLQILGSAVYANLEVNILIFLYRLRKRFDHLIFYFFALFEG